MADKLLKALATGSYKSTVSPVKETVKEALDPKVMKSIYSMGILGPIIRNVVSEYNKESNKKSDVRQQAKNAQNASAASFQTLSNQLSTLTDVMEEVRDIAKSQLALDKNQLTKLQRSQTKKDFESSEQKLEKKSPISSLAQEYEKEGGAVGKLASFAMTNPITTALSGLLLTSIFPQLREFLGGFLDKAKSTGAIDKGTKSIQEDVSKGVKILGEGIGVSITETMSKMISSGLLTGILSKALFGKFKLGMIGGAGAEAAREAGITSDSPSETIGTGLKAAGAAAAGYYTAKYGYKAYKAIKGMRSAPTTSPVSPTTQPAGTSRVVSRPVVPAPLGSKADQLRARREQRTAAEAERRMIEDQKRAAARQAERSASKGSIKSLSTRLGRVIQKRGIGWVTRFIGMRLGAGAISFAAGPVGIVVELLVLGYTIYEISNMIDEADQASSETVTSGATGMSAEPPTSVPAPSTRPSISATGQTMNQPMSGQTGDLSMADYERMVVSLESGGRNIKAENSNAFGLYQIMPKTFEGLKKNYPELKGFSWEDFQRSPEIQRMFFRKLTEENKSYLEKSGINATPDNLYMAHLLGAPRAVKLLSSDKNTDVSNVLPSDVLEANPFLKGKTVGGVQMAIAKKANSPTIATSAGARPGVITSAITDESPLAKLDIIKGLSEFASTMRMAPPIIISSPTVNNNGGGSSTNTGNRSQTPSLMPYVREHDKLRTELG